jgi:hypothetical protein
LLRSRPAKRNASIFCSDLNGIEQKEHAAAQFFRQNEALPYAACQTVDRQVPLKASTRKMGESSKIVERRSHDIVFRENFSNIIVHNKVKSWPSNNCKWRLLSVDFFLVKQETQGEED